jgi:hypothetical protein
MHQIDAYNKAAITPPMTVHASNRLLNISASTNGISSFAPGHIDIG